MSAYPQAANICPCESLREALRKPLAGCSGYASFPSSARRACNSESRLQARDIESTHTSLRYEPATSSLRPQVRVRDPARNSTPASLHQRAALRACARYCETPCAAGPAQRADLCRRPPRSDRPPPLRPAPQRRRAPIGKFATKMSNLSLRPTYREVTVCDGTFPDTATYLHGFDTLIGFSSFESGGLARYAAVQNVAARTRSPEFSGLSGSPALLTSRYPSLPAPRSSSYPGPGLPVFQTSPVSRFSLSPSSPGSPSSPDFPAPEHSWLPGTQFPRSSVPRRPSLSGTLTSLAPRHPGTQFPRPPGSLSFAFAGCDTLGNRNLVRRRIFLETLSADAPC